VGGFVDDKFSGQGTLTMSNGDRCSPYSHFH